MGIFLGHEQTFFEVSGLKAGSLKKFCGLLAFPRPSTVPLHHTTSTVHSLIASNTTSTTTSTTYCVSHHRSPTSSINTPPPAHAMMRNIINYSYPCLKITVETLFTL